MRWDFISTQRRGQQVLLLLDSTQSVQSILCENPAPLSGPPLRRYQDEILWWSIAAPWDITTNHHTEGGLNDRNLFSLSSGGQESQIKVPARRALSEGSREESFLISAGSWWPRAFPVCGCVTLISACQPSLCFSSKDPRRWTEGPL